MPTSLISHIASTARVLRLTPFDTSTEYGRSQERNRRIAWTGVSAVAAKGAAALAMLISVPVTLDYLGPERFGLWVTVSATIAMLTFADFGLSNGLMNAVAHAKGRDAPQEMRCVVSNAVIALSGIALGLAALVAILYPLIPWAAVFNVSGPLAKDEAGPLVLVVVACFIANMPFAATQKVQLGLQRGYLSNFWESLGSILGLVFIVTAVQLDAGLAWIALAMAGVPVIARLVNSLVFFGRQMPSLRPRWSRFEGKVVVRLFRIGALFFILQLAVIVGMQTDNIIIARTLGAEAVAGYDVVFKLAVLPSMFIGFVVLAQWPAYAEAQSRGDLEWIRATFLSTLRISLVFASLFAILLVIMGRSIIGLWAGPDVVPQQTLVLCMALWSVLAVAGSAIAALLNGLHIVKFQAVNSTLMAVANILLSIYLVRKIGVVGAVLGSIVAYVIFTLIPCWFYIRRVLFREPSQNAELPIG